MTTTAFSLMESRNVSSTRGKTIDFHGARQVFHAGKRHHGIGFCCHHPVFDNGADDAHMRVIQYMGILPGQCFDGVGGEPRRLFPVSVQRVAGQVQAADILFLLQQLLYGCTPGML